MKISTQTKQSVLKAIQSGETAKDVAKKFNVSEASIWLWKKATSSPRVRARATLSTRTTRKPRVLARAMDGNLARENQILRGIVGQQLVEQLLKTH